MDDIDKRAQEIADWCRELGTVLRPAQIERMAHVMRSRPRKDYAHPKSNPVIGTLFMHLPTGGRLVPTVRSLRQGEET